jgi:ligand-binding sensor domain-containing protein
MICGLGLVGSGRSAAALDVGRKLIQFHHTAWTIADGAPPDVWALAQSPDGFLWLGTGAGLFRFDGLRFENVRPESGAPAPSSNINSLYSAPSGDLWIGYSDGALSLLRHGRLSNFSLNTPGAAVSTIVQDRSGVIWASLEGPGIGALGRFEDGRWQVMGPDRGVPRGAIYSAMAARDGSVWVTTDNAVLVHRPGAKTFVSVGPPISEGAHLTEGPDGRIWVSRGAYGLHPGAQLERGDGRLAPALAAQVVQPAGLNARRSLFDRDGALWGADMKGGVFRLAHPSSVPDAQSPALRDLDRFTMANGLSSELSVPLLEDHEGDVWVGTNLGLDRFRLANIVAEEGIPATAMHGFEAAVGPRGLIYVTTDTTLYEVRPGQPTRSIAKLPTPATFIYPDREGRFWIGQYDGLLRLSRGRLHRVDLPTSATGRTLAWLQFPSGVIWISVRGRGVFSQTGGRWRRVVIPGTPPDAAPAQMRLDRGGEVWLSFGRRLQRLEGPRLHDFSALEGLAVGDVNIITPTSQGIVVGGDFGIARFDGKRFHSLTSERFPAFTRVSGIVQTAQGETWLNTIKGVTRISTRDLSAALDDPSRPLRLQTFDLGDGLPGVAQQDAGTPTALQASDGRIWLVTSHGMAWLDPSRISRNPNPPPVSILAVIADGRKYRLPAGWCIAKRRVQPGDRLHGLEFGRSGQGEVPLSAFGCRSGLDRSGRTQASVLYKTQPWPLPLSGYRLEQRQCLEPDRRSVGV